MLSEMNGSTLCRHPGTIDGQPVTIQKCQVRHIAQYITLFSTAVFAAFELFVLHVYNALSLFFIEQFLECCHHAN